MEVNAELVALLKYLLPGLLAAWVYYAFTAFRRPEAFERVIQALIFTGIVQLIVFAEYHAALWIGECHSFGPWTAHSEIGASVISALVFGAAAAKGATYDWMRPLRAWGLTTQMPYPSEWYGAFHDENGYVVVQLKDERRIMGWPTEWPSSPHAGHLRLQEAQWLSATDDPNAAVDLPEVSSILISVDDVRWIEFLKVKEISDDAQAANPTTAIPAAPGAG